MADDAMVSKTSTIRVPLETMNDQVDAPSTTDLSSHQTMNYFHELPDELLLHVMSLLGIADCEPPSARKFPEEPSPSLTVSESTPLKDFSLVCRRWRNLVLPDLFRHSRLRLELVQDEEDVLLRKQSFTEFIVQRKLQTQVKSLVVYTDIALPDKCTDAVRNALNTESRTLWRDIFSTLNPQRVVVAAPPTTMELLTEGRMQTQDAWAFEMRMHYVEFRQEDSGGTTTATCDRPGETGHRYYTCLHNIRPWTHMGYNEGSYLPAYSTYEYFWRNPPQIPYYLLWMMTKQECSTSPKLRSFSYYAIFPFGRHVSGLTKLLAEMKTLHTITTRIAPSPRTNILDDPQRVGKADFNDCWTEFQRCQNAIARLARRSESLGCISSLDYRNESLAKDLDLTFGMLERGWSKGVDGSWVRPHPVG